MSHSNSLKAYEDVHDLFREAVQHNGLRVKCETNSQAVRLRARLHHFRTLDRALMQEVHDPGHPRYGISTYDDFVVRIAENVLTIEPQGRMSYTTEPLNPPTEEATSENQN